MFEVDLNTFCDGNSSLPIKVECLDHEKSGKHKLIGEAWFTVDEIINKKYEFGLIDSKKATFSGKIVVSDVNI